MKHVMRWHNFGAGREAGRSEYRERVNGTHTFSYLFLGGLGGSVCLTLKLTINLAAMTNLDDVDGQHTVDDFTHKTMAADALFPVTRVRTGVGIERLSYIITRFDLAYTRLGSNFCYADSLERTIQ